MRRILRSAVIAAGAGGAAALSTWLLGVDRSDHVLDAYLVFLAAVAAVAVARVAAGALPRPRGVLPALLGRRPPRRPAPESLTRIEDVEALAQADQLDLHFRLRPLLAGVAAAAYSSRAGGDRQELPAAAETTFSPGTWELVRPDRPRPAGPGERGISSARLRAVLDELESILRP